VDAALNGTAILERWRVEAKTFLSHDH
jgi:hypothetical protein